MMRSHMTKALSRHASILPRNEVSRNKSHSSDTCRKFPGEVGTPNRRDTLVAREVYTRKKETWVPTRDELQVRNKVLERRQSSWTLLGCRSAFEKLSLPPLECRFREGDKNK